VCGIPSEAIVQLEPQLRSRVDVLGVVDHARAQQFAGAMDLGLVPLEDHPFNWSRFPVRFAHFLAANVPVLFSEIGDLATFSKLSGVLPAGNGRQAWLSAFRCAVSQLAAGELRPVDSNAVENLFSWDLLAKQLQAAYLASA